MALTWEQKEHRLDLLQERRRDEDMAAFFPKVVEALKLAMGIATANPEAAGIVSYCGGILAEAQAIMSKEVKP